MKHCIFSKTADDKSFFLFWCDWQNASIRWNVFLALPQSRAMPGSVVQYLAQSYKLNRALRKSLKFPLLTVLIGIMTDEVFICFSIPLTQAHHVLSCLKTSFFFSKWNKNDFDSIWALDCAFGKKSSEM